MAESKINIRALFDLKGFSTSAQNLERRMKKTARELNQVGQQMSTAFTLPALALGGLAVREFANFEQSMAKVAAVSGATNKELEELTKLAKDLGISTRYTSSQVSDLQLNYAKLGFSSEEIKKITGATLSLALATGEDLANSAETAGATLRGFQMDASNMQQVVDVMANSFSSSSLNLERFGTAMGYIAPVANAAGISLERATSMMSTLSDAGIEASTVGTSLRQIFIQLATKGISYEDAMSRIKNATDKVIVANDLFGDRAFAAGIVLAEQGVKVNELTEKYLDSEGAAKRMADIMDNTLQGSLFKLKSAVEGLFISLGEKLAPTISKVAGKLSQLAMNFAEISNEKLNFIIKISAIVAAIGPLLLGLGAVTTALTFMAANPIIAAIAGITGLVTWFGGLNDILTPAKKKTEEFSEATKVLNGATNEFKQSLEKEEATLKSYFDELKKTNKGTKERQELIDTINRNYGTTLKNINDESLFIKQLDDAYGDLLGTIRKKLALQIQESSILELMEKEAAIMQTLDNLYSKLEEAGTKQGDGSFNWWRTVNTEIAKQTGLLGENREAQKKLLSGSFFQDAAKQITRNTDMVVNSGGKMSKAFKELNFVISEIDENKLKNIGKMFSNFIEKQKKALNNELEISINLKLPKSNMPSLDWIDEQGAVIKAKYKQIGQDISQALNDGLETLATNSAVLMGEFLGNVMSGSDVTIEDFGKSLLNAIGMFMVDFGAAMISIGVAQSAIAKAIALGPLGAPLAIIGGIALVAAGTALSNVSKKGIEGAGGPSSPSPSASSRGMNNLDLQPIVMETRINGRDILLVQDRSKSFRR